MPDTLKELSRDLGRKHRDVEFLKRRGGLLPSIDRTRGSMEVDRAYIMSFTVNQNTRKVALKLAFHKLAIS